MGTSRGASTAEPPPAGIPVFLRELTDRRQLCCVCGSEPSGISKPPGATLDPQCGPVVSMFKSMGLLLLSADISGYLLSVRAGTRCSTAVAKVQIQQEEVELSDRQEEGKLSRKIALMETRSHEVAFERYKGKVLGIPNPRKPAPSQASQPSASSQGPPASSRVQRRFLRAKFYS